MLLALQGGREILSQQVSPVHEEITHQPQEPGYLELVDATPTLLALHVHDGSLAGVSVLARTGIDAGGGVVLLSPDLYVRDLYVTATVSPGDEAQVESGQFVGDAYVEGGADAVERLAETLFGFGFDDVIELSSEAMAASINPAGPLPYLLLDDLIEVAPDGSSRIVFAAGRTELSAQDAARVYAFRNPDEADVNRLERQRALWESWLAAVRRAPDPAAAVLALDTGVHPFVRALSAATSVVEIPPMQATQADSGSTPRYWLAQEGRTWLEERALSLVPWPAQPSSFWRPRVQLLDGTGDPAVRDSLVDDVVAGGGVITVIGNAPEFGVQRSEFAYHREELVTDPTTNAIAFELGLNMTLIVHQQGTLDLADITVTVGSDGVAR